MVGFLSFLGKIKLVIILRKKTKRFLKISLFLICFELVIFSCGYFYLDSRLKKTLANESVESVPYYTQVPENKTVLMTVCQDKILLNLNFKEEIINIIFLETEAENYGYTVDYDVICNYEMIGYLVDVAGGIELDGLRYTGVQITEMLEYNPQDITSKKLITQNIINGIAKNGFTKEKLLYIIDNSETNLKFNQCFDWENWIPKLCRLPRFIN